MITQEECLEYFNYDPLTGIVTWAKDNGRIKAGSIAGSKHNRGYLTVRFKYKSYLLHRLIWFRETGEWPENIDHKDLNRTNNRWKNLRPATVTQNNHNVPKKKNAKCPFIGVYPHGRKWRAFIRENGKRKYIGSFETAQEAADMYDKEVIRIRGKFAQTNKGIAA